MGGYRGLGRNRRWTCREISRIGGDSSGGARRTDGGKGEELYEANGGKVWRFEAGSRNGGTGADSSAEELGTKDIAGEGFGGVVRWKERTRVGTEDECGCRGGLKGSFCGGLNIDRKSHLQIFHDTIIDVRRMYSSEYILSNPHALTPQIVETLCKPIV